ncbi:hypothetical protein ATANTOWER_001881 [Ataeniobius toweri]|uniref:Uncharacterized protein n=1 Tax=Ataeniobius toweri TaxID=208326 RepID=A0ABU7B6A3_9TELE|nr:hypothetical protein [Ataeniobius toweri]
MGSCQLGVRWVGQFSQQLSSLTVFKDNSGATANTEKTAQFVHSLKESLSYTMTDSEYLDKTLTDGASGGLKKSKKKQKRENAWRPEGPRDPFAMLDSLPEKEQQEIQKALHLFSLGNGLPKTLQEAKKHTYRFWDTQPVPKLGK